MRRTRIGWVLILLAINVAVFTWNQQHGRVFTLTTQMSQTIMITKTGFSPKHLTCKQGDTVSLVIRNTDNQTHNFTLADYHIFSRDLKKDEMSTIEFQAVKKGTFTFISDTPGHPEVGFDGTLEVK